MLKDELVRDRLVSGIQNDCIREKLLSKKDFTLTKAIQLLKSSEATQMQAQDMAAPSEMGTVQVIKSRKQKPSNERKLTQPGGKVYKHCWYCGRKHELKKEACPVVDKVLHASPATKRVILQSSAGQQGFIILKMITVRTKKYSLFMQLNATIVNLL